LRDEQALQATQDARLEVGRGNAVLGVTSALLATCPQ
jgi:hypothetical protein